MSDPSKVAAPQDPKGRLVSIFVGAVLLPSLALSYASIYFVPELAKGRKATAYRGAEKTLYYMEKDLDQTARSKALEAARAIGSERLIDGRPQVIQAALREAGLAPDMFASIRMEGASAGKGLREWVDRRGGQTPREVLSGLDPETKAMNEDKVPWAEGRLAGVVRYRFSPEYVRRQLIPSYFESEFASPDVVVRVAGTAGDVVYETAPTPANTFEVHRVMETPSFRGLKLALRQRVTSIEKDVRLWEIGTFAVIGFIDLMLAAGLFLVYSNVRREMHLARLKSDFVANVSHELKTPLALIRLFAETLELGRVPSEDKARQYYRVINKESQRLTQLINNILDFSRIEAGRKEYRLAPTSVGRVVNEVVDSYRFQIEQQGFELSVEVADDLPEVAADEEALGQAILNLLNNAIKYSRDQKSIQVKVYREGNKVLIAVADRGIGIPKGEQRKIFEKFYRGEDSLVHDTKGSGLGLPLVQHIMEAHGGGVEVESVPFRGSTFVLSLPVRRGSSAKRVGDEPEPRPA